jgi:hypothetical protein
VTAPSSERGERAALGRIRQEAVGRDENGQEWKASRNKHARTHDEYPIRMRGTGSCIVARERRGANSQETVAKIKSPEVMLISFVSASSSR